MKRDAILGDWGTSNLRLWLQRGGHICDRRTGSGLGALRDKPGDELDALTADWLAQDPALPIVLCGMAGARGGLREAGYVECPASAGRWSQLALRTPFGRGQLRIAPGLACEGADGRHPDVMRGEETQIFGALARQPGLAAGPVTFLLPGTHSKWVELRDGCVTAFRTFMTGEMFALLGGSSLFAVGQAGAATEEEAGMTDGIAESMKAPGLAGSLFHARSMQLRRARSGAWARGYVSGVLIGAEIAEMRHCGPLPHLIWLVGEQLLVRRYAMALAAFGIAAQTLDPDACTLAGLEMILAQD